MTILVYSRSVFSMYGENYGIPAVLEHIPSFVIMDNLRNKLSQNSVNFVNLLIFIP
jgi:hypothetical protein